MTKILTPLVEKDKRYPIVGWDSEFCPYHGGREGFLVGALSHPETGIETYRDGHEYVEALLHSRNREALMYAHNVEVDIARSLEPYLPDGYDLKVLSVGYSVLAATVTDAWDHYWRFRDSSQISYYATLDEVGELLEHPKTDPGFPLDRCLCDLSASQLDDLEAYCGRDADVTREWVEELQEILVGEFGAQLERTAAGTSMGVWRRNHQQQDYPVLPPWHRDFIRDSYRGGRTEMFRQGPVSKVYGYDINSLYPYAYATYPMPDPNTCMGLTNVTVDELRHRMKHGAGFARCLVDVPPRSDLTIPYLGYFDEDRGKLVFPRGRLRGTWTYLELREALDRGYEILEVDRVSHFSRTCNPFESFGRTLYDLKQRYGDADDEIRYRVVKLLLNSFYGRFGVDTTSSDAGYYVFPRDKNELREKVWEADVWTSDMIDAYEDDALNYYFEPFGGDPPPYCHPEWASKITAAARHELYTWFERVGPENVLYCDTDSVYSLEPLPGEALSEDLGGMDHEFTGPADFRREKGYALFHDDGSLEKVKASGLNFKYLGEEKTERLWNAYRALRDGVPVETPTWGGLTGPIEWQTVEPQVKRLGDSWQPKREYTGEGSRALTFDDATEITT